MPIKFAAVRQLRKDRPRTERNQAIRSELKTLKKRIRSLIADRKREEALQLMPTVMRRFDHAVAKGVIHRNLASRTKSRFMQQLHRLSPPPQATK
ncbi:MAG: 30S ribosomal protein S20 [Candidatus Omnitrophica bacterium]|nr:30S ribosomal protein S20 [Candidatus Omnitrophota bacterium]